MNSERSNIVRDTLRDLERAVSALHAHDLHQAIAPQYRDLYEQVIKAREVLALETPAKRCTCGRLFAHAKTAECGS